MLRQLSLVCIVLFSACVRNGGSVQVADEFKKKDFITCTDKAIEGSGAESQGAKILRDSERAYAALQSYVGSIRVEDVVNYERGSFGQTYTFKVFFQSPAKIRLEGVVPNSGDLGKCVIVSDGQATKVFGFGVDGTRKTLQDALLEFSGVSADASLMLPSFLMGLEWHRDTFGLPYGTLLPAYATRAILTGEQKIGEHRCYRIVCPRDIATWTFYVDKETLLIRRLDENTSEDQMRLQRELGGGGFTGRIQASRLVQSFEVEQVNVKLDETMFARP